MEEASEKQREAKKISLDFINKKLNKYNGHIEFDYDVIEDILSVTYDGGAHPEFASNAFSSVYGIFKNKKGKICLCTEDCEEYEIDSINDDEIYDVAMFIYENENEFIKKD